jgi:hypothetical protein
VITSGVAAFNELGPDHSVGDDIIDKDHPGYDQRVLDLEILPMMFGIVLKEGKRGVWRLQNLVLERTGILVTDELARIPIAHLTSGHKKSNKLKDGVEKIKRIDDIAKHVGDGDGLTEISRKRNPRLRLLMLDLIKDCKGRDVSSNLDCMLIIRILYLTSSFRANTYPPEPLNPLLLDPKHHDTVYVKIQLEVVKQILARAQVTSFVDE